MKFFDIAEVIESSGGTTLFNIVGKRGVGKTFSAKKYAIQHFLDTNHKFLYIRRQSDEIRHSELADLFSDVWHHAPEVQKAINEKYALDNSFIDYWGGFFYIATSDGKKTYRIVKIGRAACVSKARSFKGAPYNEYDFILFDEVITDAGYVSGDKEPELFNKIIDTVARAENSKVKIVLCGNPDKNVEACPYFYGLKIDYNKLNSNEIFYFNSVAPTGEIIKNNIMFIKLAGGADEGTFLNVNTGGLFGTAESFMSYSGDVKTDKYNRFSAEIKSFFNPLVHLTVETAVILANERHRAIHAYYGFFKNQPALVILAHERLKACNNVFCRYDYLKIPDLRQNQMFRLVKNPEFRNLNHLIDMVDSTQFIFTDDDYTATTFFNIKNE